MVEAMHTVKSMRALRKALAPFRQPAFVPAISNLHAARLSLCAKLKSRAIVVGQVVS
jgi:pantothenate synthetase